ncbi:DUF2946 family protein [Sphingomonas sp. ASV193]|uniref:DUF2946 family protein n=1 Tax=Sphingomonas sp. ASV193 TaxID=3144405 RepID=UPI0032E8BA04
MTRAPHPSRRHRLGAVLLALLLAARLLVPVGFMPSAGASGFAIVACPDDGPTLPALDSHHGHVHGAKGAKPGHCPFAIGGHAAADLAQPPPLGQPGWRVPLNAADRTPALLSPYTGYARPPVRGPPTAA